MKFHSYLFENYFKEQKYIPPKESKYSTLLEEKKNYFEICYHLMCHLETSINEKKDNKIQNYLHTLYKSNFIGYKNIVKNEDELLDHFIHLESRQPTKLKCAIIGNETVGKSKLQEMLLKDRGGKNKKKIFSHFQDLNNNIVASFLKDDVYFHIDEYNIAKYKSRIAMNEPQWDPEIDVVLICFAVDDYDGYNALINKWVPEIRKICNRSVYVTVATKVALRNDKETIKKMKLKIQSPITLNEGKLLAEVTGSVAYVETSAEENIGIKECLELAIRSYFICSPSKNRKSSYGRKSRDSIQALFKKRTSRGSSNDSSTSEKETIPDIKKTEKTEKRKSKILSFLGEKLNLK